MGLFEGLLGRIRGWEGLIGTSARNLYTTFGYTDNVQFEHRFRKYLRQDIAARIVDAPAAALWTNPPEIISTSDSWNEAWGNLVARHDLYAAIEKADKLAGIGRFSILIIGFNDGNGLEMPVNTARLHKNEQKVLFLQVYSEQSVRIESFVRDSSSERFQKPEYYTVQPDAALAVGFDSKGRTGKLGSFRVHASRVIHIAENTLENDIYGSPRMERVYNVLDDLLKVVGGSAETFWLIANRGLHIDVDKEMELEGDDAAALSDEVDEYEAGLRRVIRTRGVTVKPLGSDRVDPTGVFKVIISCISGATGIPSRILIGSEAGQLASEQDRANWADRIDERRANFGNPVVLHQLIKRLTEVRYFEPEELIQITIAWPSAFKMSPLEASQTSAQHARSATNFAKAIETMHTLNQGTPGSEGKVDGEGNPIPGTAIEEVPGADLGELVTIDEARRFIGLDKPKVTFDSGDDLLPPKRGRPIKPRSQVKMIQDKVNIVLTSRNGRM